MPRKINEHVWDKLSEHLDDSDKEYVLEKFSDCFDYSPNQHWTSVIADLVKIMKHRENHNKDLNYKVMQVKTKFGRMRFYVENCDDYLYGAIRLAEEQCYKICNTCGSYGKEKLNTGSYNKSHCTWCTNLYY